METAVNVTGLGHVGIPTDNLEETVAFYEGLGFRTVHRTKNPESGKPVAFLEQSGLLIETWEGPEIAGQSGAIDHIALEVDDVEQAFCRLQNGGYRLLDSDVRFLPFWENGVRFFTIEGPNREKVEFCQKL